MRAVVRGVVVAWVVVLAACKVGPYPPPAPPRQTNLGLRISSSVLPNGLRVVLVHDPRATEVQVTMRYQVGSVDDPADQPGMAHLVEHLMFQQILGAQSLFAHLEDFATHFNAGTSYDATTYVERAHPSRLDQMLSIEAIRLGFRCTSITDAAFIREREVVINELRQRDHATELIGAFHEGLYPAGHPYRRAIGGSGDVVGAITRDQACAFADKHYGSTNAVLVVSGNVTAPQLEASLKKFLARVAKRSVAAPAPVPAVALAARKVTAKAPIDDAAVVFAWPLPADPQLRAKVRALMSTASAAVDAQVKGSVVPFQLGDGRAPMIGVAVFPTTAETIEQVIEGAQKGLDGAAATFRRDMILGDLLFDRLQQSAIYALFATLEDGGDRDTRLATYVLAGRDPSEALGAEIQGLRRMTPDEASSIVREQFSFERATIIRLEPRDSTKSGNAVSLTAPVHDIGQRRDPPDPADAHRPILTPPRAPNLAAVQTRTLPNGLKVVLVPVTSVPTVDMRIVFAAGTADEPAAKRGVALLAGQALSWDLRHLNDLMSFAAAGGKNDVDVQSDHTSFQASGLDMHLDLLLAGLRRWTRDGRYERNLDGYVAAMRTAKQPSDQGSLSDAWRTALYGGAHPYVHGGLYRHTSEALGRDDALAFRAAHYTPDNATLVIAGGFDPALANQWIDYLFADWAGHASVRPAPRAVAQPVSVAITDPTVQVQLRIVLPAGADRRGERLVAAAMLEQIAYDVRHQLGATYGLSAELLERRLSASYFIAGSIDAARTAEAMELLRGRIEALRTDPDAAARAFVTARSKVLTHLVSIGGSAAELASEVERDVAMNRPPMSNAQTAVEVQALTIEAMTSVLTELDLSRAAILMRGPTAEMDRAFGVLGRTPTYAKDDEPDREQIDPSAITTAAADNETDQIWLSDLSDSLTEQAPPFGFTFALTPGYAFGTLLDAGERINASGLSIAGEVGYRIQRGTSVGLNLSLADLSGHYDISDLAFIKNLQPIDVRSIGIAAFLQASAYDRVWGSLLIGLHLDRVTKVDTGVDPVWDKSVGLGLQGGVDVIKLQRNRLGLFARVEGEFLSEVSFASFVLGLAYRR